MDFFLPSVRINGRIKVRESKLGDEMFDAALKLLNTLAEKGFEAYVVGGFVRDYLMGIESNDIDICTNAQPKDVRSIFKDACLPAEDYGSVTVILRNIRFEITTFRREFSYVNHRKPGRVEFINDLQEDLRRRDFLMNTLCIDRHGNVIDLLHGKEDIDHKVIQTVGDSYTKFSEDAFRILRAVRFSTYLGFQLSPEIKEAITKTKHLLKDLSYQRKREELDKIFTNVHVKEGVSLLLELGLDFDLELPKLKDLRYYDDLIGIWAQLEVQDLYPFTKNEKELIQKIQEVYTKDNLHPKVLYMYGFYVNSVAANIKGISKKEITSRYNSLPIKSRSDIVLDGEEIASLLDKKPGGYLREIYRDLEDKILSLELANEKEALVQYVLNHYRDQ